MPDLEGQFARARARALLAGLGALPRSGVAAAEATAFADQAVVALRDAIANGYVQGADVDELDGPDFVALRQRNDFQKLVKELQAKQKEPAP